MAAVYLSLLVALVNWTLSLPFSFSNWAKIPFQASSSSLASPLVANHQTVLADFGGAITAALEALALLTVGAAAVAVDATVALLVPVAALVLGEIACAGDAVLMLAVTAALVAPTVVAAAPPQAASSPPDATAAAAAQDCSKARRLRRRRSMKTSWQSQY
jgi:hypothetical protein